jgi:hypothetical protein
MSIRMLKQLESNCSFSRLTLHIIFVLRSKCRYVRPACVDILLRNTVLTAPLLKVTNPTSATLLRRLICDES